MTTGAIPRDALGLAARQSGLVTLEQLDSLPSGRSFVGPALMSGAAFSTVSGVIRIGNEQTPLEEPFSYWLRFAPQLTVAERRTAGPLVVGSHLTAAYVLGLEVLPDGPWTFVSPESVAKVPGLVEHSQVAIDPSEVVAVDGLPVTNATRMLADLITNKTDLSVMASLVDSLSRLPGLISIDSLRDSLSPLRTVLGAGPNDDIVAVLLDRDMGPVG